MKQLVSVVIPVYNAERTVVRALESVRLQTYPYVEVILLNDGSKDASMRLILEYLNKFPMQNVLVDRENRGVSYTRNEGIRVSHGEYIAFLDADDQWYPEKLKIQMQCMEQTGGALVSCLKCEETKTEPVSFIPFKKLIFKNYVFTSSVLVKKDILLRLGGFNESMGYGEDYNLWLRIACQNDIYVMNQKLITYEDAQAHPEKKSLSTNLKAMEKGELESYRMLRKQNKISLWLWFAAVMFSLVRYGRRKVNAVLR